MPSESIHKGNQSMLIKNRIKELRTIKASELLPNPKNWRGHPDAQANTLRAVLADVGFADAAIARETPDGIMLIDGHLRTEVAADSEIPVLIVDLTEEEADKVLATLDPIAAMADLNASALGSLIANMDAPESVTELLDAVMNNYEPLTLDINSGDFSEDYAGDESEGLDSQFEIVVTCNGELHQRELLQRLTDEGLTCRSLIS